MQHNDNTNNDLSTKGMLLLALPSLPLGLTHGPSTSILATLYVSHFGLSFATVGMVLLIARLFDAITDPLIGYYSDKTKSTWGKRKPFVLVGALVITVAIYFVFLPPENPSMLYFLGWYIFLYLGWTIMEIPLSAWASEVTSSNAGRVKVFMFRAMMLSAGGVLVFAVPFLPIFETSEITPEAFNMMGLIGIVLIPLFTIIALRYVPQGKELGVKNQTGLMDFFKSVKNNPPFLFFVVTSLLYGFGVGIYYILSFLFFTQILGFVEGFAVIAAVSIAAGIPAFYFWKKVSDRIGTKYMCAISNFAAAICLFSILFIPPGKENFILALVIIIIATIAISGWNVGVGPLLAQTADYDLLKTGVDRLGKYFSFQAFAGKLTFGAASGVAFTLVGLFDYDGTHGATNTPEAIAGFKFIMIGIPVILTTICGFLLLKFPIDTRKHAIIRKRIESRAKRQLKG